MTVNATGVFLAALETVFNLFVRNKERYTERKKKKNVSVVIIKHTHTRLRVIKRKAIARGSILFSLSLSNREN